MKLTVSYSEKVPGEAQYSSKSAMITIEADVDPDKLDMEANILQARAEKLVKSHLKTRVQTQASATVGDKLAEDTRAATLKAAVDKFIEEHDAEAMKEKVKLTFGRALRWTEIREDPNKVTLLAAGLGVTL